MNIDELTEQILEITNNSDYGWIDLDSSDAERIRVALTKALTIGAVSSMLPSMDSSTFKNYLEAKGYAETLNPLVYKKQGFKYDKEILHRHFLNEIEFGN